MLETSARLLRLLSLLQSRRDWRGTELAGRLGVGLRTVRRDIGRLRDLGYPVEATPGAAGGYWLGVGAALPPLLLDDDEAVAVAISLHTAAVSSVAGLEETSLRALTKLQQMLPSRLRHRVSAFHTTTVPLTGPGLAADSVDPDLLTAVAAACRDHRCLRLRYRGRSAAPGRGSGSQPGRGFGTALNSETDGNFGNGGTGQGSASDLSSAARRENVTAEENVTVRVVEPHRLVHTPRRWYLLAWDVDRADWRTFRVDRIAGPLGPPGARFAPRPLPSDDPAAYVSQAISSAPYRYQARILVHAPAEDLARRSSPTAGRIEPAGADRCILHTGSNSLDELALYIGLKGFDVEVLDPPELVETLRDLSARLARAAQASASAPD
jgi:predicted DNA-binding transcriptional regulator YafY